MQVKNEELCHCDDHFLLPTGFDRHSLSFPKALMNMDGPLMRAIQERVTNFDNINPEMSHCLMELSAQLRGLHKQIVELIKKNNPHIAVALFLDYFQLLKFASETSRTHEIQSIDPKALLLVGLAARDITGNHSLENYIEDQLRRIDASNRNRGRAITLQAGFAESLVGVILKKMFISEEERGRIYKDFQARA